MLLFQNHVLATSVVSFQLTDYINASFMDGYKQRNAYIGTQGTECPQPSQLNTEMHSQNVWNQSQNSRQPLHLFVCVCRIWRLLF